MISNDDSRFPIGKFCRPTDLYAVDIAAAIDFVVAVFRITYTKAKVPVSPATTQ